MMQTTNEELRLRSQARAEIWEANQDHWQLMSATVRERLIGVRAEQLLSRYRAQQHALLVRLPQLFDLLQGAEQQLLSIIPAACFELPCPTHADHPDHQAALALALAINQTLAAMQPPPAAATEGDV